MEKHLFESVLDLRNERLDAANFQIRTHKRGVMYSQLDWVFLVLAEGLTPTWHCVTWLWKLVYVQYYVFVCHSVFIDA